MAICLAKKTKKDEHSRARSFSLAPSLSLSLSHLPSTFTLNVQNLLMVVFYFLFNYHEVCTRRVRKSINLKCGQFQSSDFDSNNILYTFVKSCSMHLFVIDQIIIFAHSICKHTRISFYSPILKLMNTFIAVLFPFLSRNSNYSNKILNK